MNRSRFLAGLLCIAWMAVQTGGAHLHFCFDGREPLASVQLGDAGMLLDRFEASSADQDMDVDLDDLALVKLPKLDLPVLAVIFVGLLWLFGSRGTEPTTTYTASFPHASGSFLRPPLRGPPAFLPYLS